MTATAPQSDAAADVPDVARQPLNPLARFVAAHPVVPLTAIAGSGALLLLLGLVGGIGHPVLARCLGMFLLLYAGIVALSLHPANPLGTRIDRFLERWLSAGSTGFYGLMAAALFCTYEMRDLARDAAAFDFSRQQLWSAFMQWLMGFSVDSMMNSIWASLWPWMLMKDHGAYAVGAMAAIGWGVYWLGARTFPHVHVRLERAAEQRKACA